jgi:hypothetical protein
MTAENKSMTVDDILRDWLKSHGYDGLCNGDDGCGCMVSSLAPCGNVSLHECKPGVLGKCDPQTCANDGDCKWHIVERGHEDQMTDAERKTFLERWNANADLADALNKRFP